MIFFMQFTFVLENNYVYRNIHLIFKKFIYFLLLEFNLKFSKNLNFRKILFF